jgi:hypothetical protein
LGSFSYLLISREHLYGPRSAAAIMASSVAGVRTVWRTCIDKGRSYFISHGGAVAVVEKL